MKKVIPFSKEIEFKTMISKITSISLEHTLRLSDLNTISGDFIIEGTYKMTQASQIDEEFFYKIPIDIAIDDKYDTMNISLDIDDFTYEVVNEEKIVLNISLCIDNLEEKQTIEKKDLEIRKLPIFDEFEKISENGDEIETLDDLFLDTSVEEKVEIPIKTEKEVPVKKETEIPIKKIQTIEKNIDEILDENKQKIITSNNNASSLFTAFKDSIETFSTYSVYIVKEGDTIDSILSKYNVLKEDLEEYNTLSEMKVGSKIIIPNSTNE